VIELRLHSAPEGLVDCVREMSGVERVSAAPDGLLTRLTVQVRSGRELRPAILSRIAEEQLESVLEREPTLEEAYLSILG
jgi:ABC-2 type transport system ATP-binding protein